MKSTLYLATALFLASALILSGIATFDVHAFRYSVVNDSWRINDTDVECYTSQCVVPFTIENSRSQNRILPIDVFTNPIPTDIQILTNVTDGYDQGSLIGCQNVSAPTNSTPRTKLTNCTYNQIRRTAMRWVPLNTSVVTGSFKGKGHKINTTGIFFMSDEVKYFKVILINILNGISKFDILWHDPVINSTLYQGNYTQDKNATLSTVAFSSNGMKISLGVT